MQFLMFGYVTGCSVPKLEEFVEEGNFFQVDQRNPKIVQLSFRTVKFVAGNDLKKDLF